MFSLSNSSGSPQQPLPPTNDGGRRCLRAAGEAAGGGGCGRGKLTEEKEKEEKENGARTKERTRSDGSSRRYRRTWGRMGKERRMGQAGAGELASQHAVV